MSRNGDRLVEWIERQPIDSERAWKLIVSDFYRCALVVGRAEKYLDGADLEGLTRRTLALVRIDSLHPADLIYLPQIHWSARQRTDRQLTPEVYDALAAALYAALVEHGVPTEVRQPVREELSAVRDHITTPAPPRWSRHRMNR